MISVQSGSFLPGEADNRGIFGNNKLTSFSTRSQQSIPQLHAFLCSRNTKSIPKIRSDHEIDH